MFAMASEWSSKCSRWSTTAGKACSKGVMSMSTALVGDVKHPPHFPSVHRGASAAPVCGCGDHVVSVYAGETKGTWANVSVIIFITVTSRLDQLNNDMVPWVVIAMVLGVHEKSHRGKLKSCSPGFWPGLGSAVCWWHPGGWVSGHSSNPWELHVHNNSKDRSVHGSFFRSRLSLEERTVYGGFLDNAGLVSLALVPEYVWTLSE